jgi:hypothetical protein
MADERERWALILGASSGMGQAAGLAFARAGYRIAGVHLDFRAGLAHVEEVKAAIVAAGSEALFVNMNAADDEKRARSWPSMTTRWASCAPVSTARSPRVGGRTCASSCTPLRSGRCFPSSPRTRRARSAGSSWR